MEKELLCILKKYEMHPDFFGDTIKDINQVGGMDDHYDVYKSEPPVKRVVCSRAISP